MKKLQERWQLVQTQYQKVQFVYQSRELQVPVVEVLINLSVLYVSVFTTGDDLILTKNYSRGIEIPLENKVFYGCLGIYTKFWEKFSL